MSIIPYILKAKPETSCTALHSLYNLRTNFNKMYGQSRIWALRSVIFKYLFLKAYSGHFMTIFDPFLWQNSRPIKLHLLEIFMDTYSLQFQKYQRLLKISASFLLSFFILFYFYCKLSCFITSLNFRYLLM